MTLDEIYQSLWNIRRWAREHKLFRLANEADNAIFWLRGESFINSHRKNI
jgi:hypothetical protein